MGLFKKNKTNIVVNFKEDVSTIYESEIAKEQMKKAEEADREKIRKLSKKLTEEEKNFINEFITRATPFAKGFEIIYNFRSGNINFEINDMQIGRISLNDNSKEMQILTKDDVIWIRPITYEEAIKNIDKWIKYMKWLLSHS